MLRALFLAEAFLSVAYGVTLIVLPSQVLELYGAKAVTGGAVYMAQLLGAPLVGLGLVAWAARNYPDSAARRMILRSFFVTELLSTYVTLGNALTQGASPIVWSLVALSVSFAVAFGYFVVKPPAQASPAAA